MLDPWIIEEILRREEEQRREERQQRIELPLDAPRSHDSERQPAVPQPPEPERGVVIIDI